MQRADTLAVFNNQSQAYFGFTSHFGCNTGLSNQEMVDRILQTPVPKLNQGFAPEYVAVHDVSTTCTTIFNMADSADDFQIAMDSTRPLIK